MLLNWTDSRNGLKINPAYVVYKENTSIVGIIPKLGPIGLGISPRGEWGFTLRGCASQVLYMHNPGSLLHYSTTPQSHSPQLCLRRNKSVPIPRISSPLRTIQLGKGSSIVGVSAYVAQRTRPSRPGVGELQRFTH
jgi:hypothetical protein